MCFVAAVDCMTTGNEIFLLPLTIRVPEKLQPVYAAAVIAEECRRAAAKCHESTDTEGFADYTQLRNPYYASLQSLISNPPPAVPESVEVAIEMIHTHKVSV